MMELKAGYKQTEVGIIPEDWNVKHLKEISPKQSVGLVINPSSYFDDNGTVPILVGSNIKENGINWEFAKRITDTSNKLIPSSRLTSGDLVTVRVGEPGITAVVPPELDGCNCASVMIVRQHNSFNSNWLCYVMNSKYGLLQVRNVQYGTAQKQFNISDAINFSYVVPSLPEQTAIATALSDTDALISSLEKLIVKKRNIKQGAMQTLLQPKEGWEVKTLGDVGDIVTGSTPPTQIKEYWNGSIPWITPTDISNIKKDIYHSEREISNAGLNVIRKLPANTLLVTCIASIGKNAILRNNGACNQQINAIIPFDDFNVDFLYYLIENNKQYLLGNAGITATLMISKKDFSNIIFSFPSPKEQTKIATILSDMDTEITALETKLAKIKAIKLGMMQELLTGKTRLI